VYVELKYILKISTGNLLEFCFCDLLLNVDSVIIRQNSQQCYCHLHLCFKSHFLYEVELTKYTDISEGKWSTEPCPMLSLTCNQSLE